ncbi:MAG TPA: transferrin receptor-like dimerization domain-containing protein [Fimbriimonadaceae bacterium]|nr:transferrin receptor-like dimerization domain-containing protein [Fimbriimonadaceae bacterium]
MSLLLLASLAFAQAPEPPPILGFTASSARAEREREAEFAKHIDKDEMRAWLKRLSAKPHAVGSPYQKENAEFILGLYKSWGVDAHIEQYDVLFPTPKERLLELVTPQKFRARLGEPPVRGDATSYVTEDQLPTYNAYSPDGDVTGELVYVNYGVPADYEILEANGVDVKGKIVISRYGGSWRGIKPKVAAEHGAIGCLIYSDPRDDGYFQGDVYPKGAYRNENGVQRGSIADMPIYPGDPLTPGYGSVPGAKRLSIKEAQTIAKIPTLPISYADALPLLRNMGGPVAPETWRGALPITYHLGGGPAKVHLKVAFNWNTVPCRDVVARFPGSERPDEWIIRGNHCDGWVTGADDPLSGQVSLLEEAKSLATMWKAGWRPKRTIIYCTWDGEEPGLLGSTEFAETHADELNRTGAVYLNSDSSGRGFFGAGGSQSLERFVTQVARDITDPETGLSVLDRARARALTATGTGPAAEPDAKKAAEAKADMPLGPLGSGSDYSSFLQHLGIASLNYGYGGEGGGGSYHSVYDSFEHYTRFIEPTFDYERTLALTVGASMLRLADADVLPFDFDALAGYISKYSDEIMKLSDDLRTQTAEQNKLLADGTLKASQDPTKPHVLPKPKDPVPYLNFAPLQNARAKLTASLKSYDSVKKNGLNLNASQQAELDRALLTTERMLLTDEGLPRRPWYRHQIYAPGFYTGYGVKTIPAVREAVEQRNWGEAEASIKIVAGVVERLAGQIDKATKILGG